MAAENTLPAFEQAVRDGADGIEIDLQRTADNELVIIHDEQTDRTTGVAGWVYASTWDSLRKLNAAAYKPHLAAAPIPRLSELLDLIKPTGLTVNIELKNGLVLAEGIEKQTWDLIKQFNMQDRVCFSSFNHFSMRIMRSISDQAVCGLLYQSGLIDPWLYAQRVGVQALHPHWTSLRIPNLVENCRAAGIIINAWTVNSPETIRMAAGLGINAIITDKPELAKQILQSDLNQQKNLKE
jgi:glycerophosphoryl diester phosphodiesterase